MYTGATSPIYATVVGVIKDVISTLKIDKNIEKVESNISNSLRKENNIKKKSGENFVSKIREFFTEFF